MISEITAWKGRKATLLSSPKVYQSGTQQQLEAAMDIDGSYFFSDGLDDLILAGSLNPPRSPHLRDRSPDEGEPVEGETLPEDALRAISAWLGF